LVFWDFYFVGRIKSPIEIFGQKFLATGFAPIWPGGLFDLFTRNLFACLFVGFDLI
jgi:hypothetical protein